MMSCNPELRFNCGRLPVLETRKAGSKESSRITGYAAIYYDGSERTQFELWPGAVERVAPGAFDKSIRSDDVRALFNHDPNRVLGRSGAGTLVLRSDEVGLRYEIEPPDTELGREVSQLIARGDLAGSSFSFAITKEKWEKGVEGAPDVRTIQEVSPLYDVGPVTFPAYEGTTAEARDRWKRTLVQTPIATVTTAARIRAIDIEQQIRHNTRITYPKR